MGDEDLLAQARGVFADRFPVVDSTSGRQSRQR
jgi:hypothetical protein